MMKRLTLALTLVLAVGVANAQEQQRLQMRLDQPFEVGGQEWLTPEAFTNAGLRCQTQHPDPIEAEAIEHRFVEAMMANPLVGSESIASPVSITVNFHVIRSST